MAKPYLLQLRAGTEGLYGESVRSGTNKRDEGKKNQDVESYEERRKTQEKNGSAVVGGDEDGERRRRQRQRRQGRGSEREGVSARKHHEEPPPQLFTSTLGKVGCGPGRDG